MPGDKHDGRTLGHTAGADTGRPVANSLNEGASSERQAGDWTHATLPERIVSCAWLPHGTAGGVVVLAGTAFAVLLLVASLANRPGHGLARAFVSVSRATSCYAPLSDASASPVPFSLRERAGPAAPVSGGAPAGATARSTIPLSYFGLTVNHNESVVFPSLPFGAIRSWDATDVSWENINTSRGKYNWAGFDAWLDYVTPHNVDILYTFGRTPPWASSKPSAHTGYGPGRCAPPTTLSDWDAFVVAVVNHAAGRIKYWELWNEPQDRTEYCGTIPQMVTMTAHAYAIIKAANPSFQVATPATLYDNGAGPKWLNTYLADGGSRYADIVSFHGYLNAPAEDHIAVIRDYKNVADQHCLDSEPLWNTESDWGKTVGPVDQAAYLAKSYLVQWGAGLSRFYWYAYDNGTYGTLFTNGALDQQGVAYRQVSSWMVGGTQSQPCSTDARATWSCGFTRANDYHALAIWNSTRAVIYKPAATYKSYRDLAGTSHTLATSITVGSSPVLLETSDTAAPASTPGPIPGQNVPPVPDN